MIGGSLFQFVDKVAVLTMGDLLRVFDAVAVNERSRDGARAPSPTSRHSSDTITYGMP
jgi:hypothetical protein